MTILASTDDDALSDESDLHDAGQYAHDKLVQYYIQFNVSFDSFDSVQY